MPGLSLGLDLGFSSNNPPKNNVDQLCKKLCEAISKTHRLEAKYRDSDITLHPYALYKSEVGTPILFAVVVCTSDHTLAGFEPKHLPLSNFTGIKITEDVFLPNCAFEAASIDETSELICSVNLVQDDEDCIEAHSHSAEAV